jgi:hypothetical protein
MINKELLYHYIKQRQIAKFNKSKGVTPWCEDDIINNNHFTNISRRDDYVTIQILNKLFNKDLNKNDLVFNIILNRLFSNRKTIQDLKVYNLNSFSVEDIIKDLAIIRNKNGKLYSGRFITIIEVPKFIESLIYHLNNNIICYESKKSFIQSIMKVNYVGGFFAWQFCSDLVLFGLIPDDNEYVILGNGSKAGLKLIDESINDLSKELKLSLEDLEHTLCEFYKYIRLRNKSQKRIN